MAPIEVPVATAFAAIASHHADSEAVVFRERRLTYRDLADRAGRLAGVLQGAGLGATRPRSDLPDHQSGQDHLAIYLRSCNEYLETLLGAFQARVAPLNVNYRYTADELHRLLADASPRAIVVHSEFTPTLASLPQVAERAPVVLQVADDSNLPLMHGATWYEDALAAAPAPAPVTPAPDDLYLLYTGGTTGQPKGVMWRNADARVVCFGGAEVDSVSGLVDAASGGRTLVAPPLMHGAGQWVAMRTLGLGGCVHLPWFNDHFDPAAIWRQISDERIGTLLIVGDSFARPLLQALPGTNGDLSNLTTVLSGGAALSTVLKQQLTAALPTALLVDSIGSSETGGQGSSVAAGDEDGPPTFPLGPNTSILSADRRRVLAPHDAEIGWLAQRGRLPLGYLGDPATTAATYVTVDDTRYCVPGDRAMHSPGGRFRLYGRDATTIITGGEKVYAEEVESALKGCAGVDDCLVAGRSSVRWGSEVVALVRWAAGTVPDHEALLTAAATRLARYKLPKAIVDVAHIERFPSGKPDYRWAAGVAAAADAS